MRSGAMLKKGGGGLDCLVAALPLPSFPSPTNSFSCSGVIKARSQLFPPPPFFLGFPIGLPSASRVSVYRLSCHSLHVSLPLNVCIINLLSPSDATDAFTFIGLLVDDSGRSRMC